MQQNPSSSTSPEGSLLRYCLAIYIYLLNIFLTLAQTLCLHFISFSVSYFFCCLDSWCCHELFFIFWCRVSLPTFSVSIGVSIYISLYIYIYVYVYLSGSIFCLLGLYIYIYIYVLLWLYFLSPWPLYLLLHFPQSHWSCFRGVSCVPTICPQFCSFFLFFICFVLSFSGSHFLGRSSPRCLCVSLSLFPIGSCNLSVWWILVCLVVISSVCVCFYVCVLCFHSFSVPFSLSLSFCLSFLFFLSPGLSSGHTDATNLYTLVNLQGTKIPQQCSQLRTSMHNITILAQKRQREGGRKEKHACILDFFCPPTVKPQNWWKKKLSGFLQSTPNPWLVHAPPTPSHLSNMASLNPKLVLRPIVSWFWQPYQPGVSASAGPPGGMLACHRRRWAQSWRFCLQRTLPDRWTSVANCSTSGDPMHGTSSGTSWSLASEVGLSSWHGCWAKHSPWGMQGQLSCHSGSLLERGKAREIPTQNKTGRVMPPFDSSPLSMAGHLQHAFGGAQAPLVRSVWLRCPWPWVLESPLGAASAWVRGEEACWWCWGPCRCLEPEPTNFWLWLLHWLPKLAPEDCTTLLHLQKPFFWAVRGLVGFVCCSGLGE